jgi:branched-chain amino acid transport system permease protein
MRDAISITLNAVLLAGLYATMSYGLALIWGVMRVINLAHAGLIMLGAYATYWLFATFHLDPLLSLPIVAAVFLGFGMAIERVLVRPLAGAPAISTLLLLFGVWLVLQNAGYFVFTGDTRAILTSYTYARVELGGGVALAVPWLAVFAASVIVLIAVQAFLSRTYLGKAIRAAAQEREACQLVGIDVRAVNTFAFGLGSALAAVGGSLLSLLYPFNPEFGGTQQLKAFCIIVLGGMQSFVGVALGALVLALAEAWSVHLGLQAALQNVVSFVLLVVALLVMPQGLIGLVRRS